MSDKAVVAIIPARGGSKGIPRKNLVSVCGKPLLAWSVIQAQEASRVDSVWVSSDDDEILSVAREYGAGAIRRPAEISGDSATSESAWLHGLESIESSGVKVGLVVGIQATSPIRESADFDRAVAQFEAGRFDSMLTVCEVEDYFNWRIGAEGPEPLNYDFRNRKVRQAIEKRYLENGSFYLFRPELLRLTGNRLGGRIGLHVMDRHKMFQIDNPADIRLCEAIMVGYRMGQG